MAERIHPVTVVGYTGTLEALGRDLARLRYDAGAVVLKAYASEIAWQMREDRTRGRQKLAGLLFDFYQGLMHAHESANTVWKLCRPHMQDELKETPEIDRR